MEKSTLALNQALPLFEEHLSDIRQALLENAQAIVEEHTPHAILDIDKPITKDAIILHVEWLYIQEHAVPLLNTIKRIDSYRYHTNPANQNSNFITDLDIQSAREATAEWFVAEAGLSTRKPHVGQCPFHPDNDPSLTLMKSKTTGNLYLKCFPCGQHWDSIGFIMKRDNLGFIDAVKRVIT
jgi:hypothetical protein